MENQTRVDCETCLIREVEQQVMKLFEIEKQKRIDCLNCKVKRVDYAICWHEEVEKSIF